MIPRSRATRRSGLATVLPVVTVIAVMAIMTTAGAASAQEPGTADRAAETIALADREFLAERYDAAESLYRDAIAMGSESVHARARAALMTAWRGDYEESIRLYHEALARDPSNFEARRGLGVVYTWAEDYDAAQAMFRSLLEERPADMGLGLQMAQAQAWSGDFGSAKSTLRDFLRRDPDNPEMSLLLARVYGSEGNLEGAEDVYRSILAGEPRNLEALNGLAEILSWENRLDESLAVYDQVLAIDPDDRTALEGKARVYHWQGRPPEAFETIRRALELYPDALDTRRLGADIGGPLRPNLQVFGDATLDSDDNELVRWGGIYRHHLNPRTYIGGSFTRARTTIESDTETVGDPVAEYRTIRFIAGRHFSRHVSLYGEIGAERTEFPLNEADGSSSGESNQHGAGSITLELNPAGWLTVVASVSQERLVGTSQAFMNDIGIRDATLTGIFRPHRTVRIRLIGQKATFTDDDDLDVGSDLVLVTDPNDFTDIEGDVALDSDDDNERDLATAVTTWALPLERPRITLNYELRWMSYDKTLDHGYFDPDHYVANTAGFDLADTIGEVFYWGAGASRGIQRINDEDDDTFSYRLLAGLNMTERASVEAFYSRSDLALSSATGFKSTNAGVRLRIRFGPALGPVLPARAADPSNDRGDTR